MHYTSFNPMLPVGRPLFVFWLAWLVWFPASAGAHEFKLNHVERSIEVVVRDHHCSVRWGVGMSLQTMVQMLRNADAISAEEHQTLSAQIRRAEKASPTGGANQADAVALQSAASPDTNADPAAAAVPDLAADPETDAKADSKTSSETALDIQRTVSELVSKHLTAVWATGLTLKVDGKIVKLDSMTFSVSPRHHVDFEAIGSVHLGGRGKAKIELTDSNFLDTVPSGDEQKPTFLYHGGIKTAFRVKGETVSINSNAAPLLSRAKPKQLAGLGLQPRKDLAVVVATIVIPREIAEDR